MDFATLFAGVPTAAVDAIADVAPLGALVLVAGAGISIAIKTFGKFGVRR